MARRSRSKTNSSAPGRPIWRGHLKLSLVTCPVAMYNAINESEDIRLNMLNPETGNRVRLKTIDAETGEELQRSELIRGYQFQKDKYIPLTNEELGDLKIESSTVMNVEQFVKRDQLDPRFYERFYYIVPDGEAGEDAYAVIRQAMAKTSTFAMTRAVISRKERVVALRPCAKGLMGYALREGTEIRDTDAFFEDIEDVDIDKDMMSIALKLVEQKTGEFDPTKYEDRYEIRLRKLIDAKLEGVELEPEAEEEEPKIIDLMEALRRSVGEGGRSSGKKDDTRERGGATVHRLPPAKKSAGKKKVAAKKRSATKSRKRA